MKITELIQDKTFTVSEFNELVNDILAPLRVCVEGEISDFRISQNKFVWFNLKDEAETLQCFSMTFRLRQPLEDGMKVKVWGYPKIFGRSGRFSFQVERVEVSGEGSLKRAFELLRAKLEAEGLFATERKRQLPQFPETLGLITSPQAAAFSDFLKQLNSRLGGLKIIFVPVSVQGENAAEEIVAAFNYFNRLKSKPDVIVLTRGGGSLEDLKEFNSEEVVRAVFSSKAPVVCGVGHERDVSLAELAADVRASTPTHAAQLVVPDRTELLRAVELLLENQQTAVADRIARFQHELRHVTSELSEIITAQITAVRSGLQQFYLTYLNFKDKLTLQKNQLRSLNKLLHSLAPAAILKRGYSIVRKSGKIIKRAGMVRVGEELEIQPAEGLIKSKVTEIKN